MKPLSLLVFGIVAAALPFLTGNQFYLHVATVVAIYWILIAALNLVVGYTGVLSIGHVGLLCVGAYAFCLLGAGPLGPLAAIGAAGLVCAFVGFLLGLPSLRLPGFYFAMVTMAFGLIVVELGLSEQWLTNGSLGLPAPDLPHPFDDARGLYWLAAGLAAVITWLTWNLARLMWGRSLIVIRDTPVAAQAFGVEVGRTKLIVFTFSGFAAGIAGALFASSQSYISPDAFVLDLGIYFFVAIIIGGRGVILGPFIGAAVLAALPELVGPLAKYSTFFYGFVLLVVVLALPGGVSQMIRSIGERLRGAMPSHTKVEPDLAALASQLEKARRS